MDCWASGGKRIGKERKKERNGEAGVGEMQGLRVFADLTTKRPLIVMKFQTVIVFNVVNTSVKSDFLSHGWILLYR